MNQIKIPDTQYPIQELIRSRWSVRAFADKAISDENLRQILEAASWSFSANNAQPWVYIYAQKADNEGFAKIFDCLVPGNQVWAKNAAVLLISIAKTQFDNGKPNKWAYHDVGAANMNLMLEANGLGILGHLMGGFDYDKTIQVFNLPESYEPVAFIALGYEGTAENLEEPFKSRELTPRTRKKIEEFAFKNELNYEVSNH
jgi:nitroreductase